jgi:competence protein ComEC
MAKSKAKYFVVVALAVLALYFSYQILVASRPLEVVFLDVGQGDSILIQKGMQQILIDGGANGKTEMAELGKYLPYFDREIEIVVLTHPDRDHIGGLVEVARNHKIGKILATAASKDTAVFREWRDVLEYNKIETVEVGRGAEVELDNNIGLKIIAPEEKVDPNIGEANDKSIVARLDFGESSFLFTGDIESGAEWKILESGENVDVDVLKIAHHGSKYSSSEAFLDAASPIYGVISVGANNSYGHPTEAVLNALKARKAQILRTDEMGDIIFECKDNTCALNGHW